MEQRLQMAVPSPSHAYILVGEPEVTLSAAKNFAKALQCEGDENGICLSCRVFESGNHPDILYVKPTKTKAIGVEDVRTQIVLPMSEKPFRYRYKIFIVDQPMTPQAQNALLKTIEEPAPFGIFLFLTAHIELYLETVLSRCVTIKMDKTGKMVEGQNQNNQEMLAFAKSAASSIVGMSLLDVYKMYAQFDKWKESIQELLDMLYLCFREQLNASSDFFRVPQEVIPRLYAIELAKKALYQNGNFQMTIESMLLKMR